MPKRGICCILVLCLCVGIVAAGDWELRFTTSIGTNNLSQEYFVVGTDPDGFNAFYNPAVDIAATPGDPGMWLEKDGERLISDYKATLGGSNTKTVYRLNGTNITDGVSFNFLNVADLPPIVGNVTVRWYYNATMPVATEISEANPSFTMSPFAFNASVAPFLPNITATYILPPAPLANFTANVTSGDAPLTVQFTNTSTGYELSTPTWNFGDGSSVVFNQETPVHRYEYPGMYDVELAIKSDGTVVNSTTKTAFINVTAPPPVVNMTADTTMGTGPLTATFTDLSVSLFPDSATLEGWEWDFGDGTNDTGRNVTHTYTTYGRFNVTLTVTDNLTQSSTRVFENYITSLAPAPHIYFIQVSAPYGWNVPVTVNYTANATVSEGFGIDSWYWEFGDGTNSSGQNTQHLYTVPGTYRVNLTVTDNQTPGQTDSSYIGFTLRGTLPVADFTASPTAARMPVTIRFTDTSTGTNISAWAWDFNSDGQVDSTEQNPSWVPVGPFPAHYSVTLNVTDENGQNQTTKANYLYINEEDDNDGPDFPPVTRATPTPTVNPTNGTTVAGETTVTITSGPGPDGRSGENSGTDEPSSNLPSSAAAPSGADTPGASDTEGPVPTESPPGSLAAMAGLAGAGAVLFRKR